MSDRAPRRLPSGQAEGARTRELQDLKAALADRIVDLARELIPEGKRAGHYWIGPRPGSDASKQNLWVNLPGARVPGTFKDPVSGDKGGPLDLIILYTGTDFKGAVAWARDWLGWGQITDQQRQQIRANAELRRREHVNNEAELLEKNRRRAFALWLKAREDLTNTPAETYLASRGIDLARLPRAPGALRFDTRRHLETGLTFPVLMSLMTGADPAGRKESVPYAVHTIFIAHDGQGKAPVTPPRKIWPSFAGAAIRLARGETDLPPADAAKQGLVDTLCLCEGVEDGLSIALACPELRVWAAGSLGNLQHITLPECCGDVIVCADNDWGKAQARASLDKAVAALERQGRPVRVARSFIGKDANDALRADAVWASGAQT